jgi:restriction endonuclease S subunit
MSPTGYHNESNMNENTILCSSSGNNAGYISKYNTKVWASDCFAIILKNNEVNNNYLYYLLKLKQEEIFKYQNGSAQPHIYSTDLSKHLKLLIPKNKSLITVLEPKFEEIEKLQNDIKQAKILYKQYIDELSKAAITQVTQNTNELIENENETKNQLKPIKTN